MPLYVVTLNTENEGIVKAQTPLAAKNKALNRYTKPLSPQ